MNISSLPGEQITRHIKEDGTKVTTIKSPGSIQVWDEDYFDLMVKDFESELNKYPKERKRVKL